MKVSVREQIRHGMRYVVLIVLKRKKRSEWGINNLMQSMNELGERFPELGVLLNTPVANIIKNFPHNNSISKDLKDSDSSNIDDNGNGGKE